MNVFVSIERHDPLRIKAIADVARGWVRNEHGYGAFGCGSIPYPGDRSLEVTLNIRVRPFGRFSSFTVFPADLIRQGDLFFERDDGFGLYAVKDGRAGVLLAVGALESELERSIDEPIYFDKVYLLQGRGRERIQMNVSLGIRPAPAEPRGDIPEWNTQFFQGGLPSLGKRKP